MKTKSLFYITLVIISILGFIALLCHVSKIQSTNIQLDTNIKVNQQIKEIHMTKQLLSKQNHASDIECVDTPSVNIQKDQQNKNSVKIALEQKKIECDISEAEKSELVSIATKELKIRDVLVEGRLVKVCVENSIVSVSFEPPSKTLGGNFIVKIDKISKKIVDVKIWR